VGGIIIGQVTKYAGGVEKGFALIAGIVVTGITEFVLFDKPLENKMIVAGALVSVSMYLHMHYPYQAPTATAKKKA
jgi:UDP-sugar transporter A1/2/3